jgi:hypothetical protein
MPGSKAPDSMDGFPRDEDATAHDLEVPTYDRAPATIEAMPSPFHHLAGQLEPNPKIVSKTAPGMPSPVLITPMGVDGDSLAGPTAPDGHPISGSFEGHTDPAFAPGPWLDSTPTQPGQLLIVPAQPQVPPPDAPNILVSQSLMLEAAHRPGTSDPDTSPSQKLPEHAPPRRQPRHGAAAMPTEVALPALKRKQAREKEGSDLPLILGLLGVGVLIALIVAVVVYALVRSFANEPVRAVPSAPPSVEAAEAPVE